MSYIISIRVQKIAMVLLDQICIRVIHRFWNHKMLVIK